MKITTIDDLVIWKFGDFIEQIPVTKKNIIIKTQYPYICNEFGFLLLHKKQEGIKREVRLHSGAIPVAVKYASPTPPKEGLRETSIFATVILREGIEVAASQKTCQVQTKIIQSFRVKGIGM